MITAFFVMRAPRLFTLLAMVGLLMLCPAEAAGRKPVPDGGRVDLGPGWRYEPLRGSSSFGGMARFSWQMDARWFLGMELGAWGGSIDVDRLALEEPPPGDVRVWVGDLRFSLGAHLVQLGSAWLYAVGGVGYHLVGVSVDDRYQEGATQGLFAGVGAYVPIGDRLGLLIEERFTLLSRLRASVGGETPMIDAGGSLLWAGLVIFFEPQPRPGGFGLGGK